MADTVTVNQIWPITGQTYTSAIKVHLTNISDGTGEANVKKVDISQFKNLILPGGGGVQPDGLRIDQVRWAIQGFTYVQIMWDRTAGPNTALVLCGSGYDDFRDVLGAAGATAQGQTRTTGLVDPSEGNVDAKGSILLTTGGNGVAGATYDITLTLKLSPNLTLA